MSALLRIAVDRLSKLEAAVLEWSEARRAVLAVSVVEPAQYDRLAKAEAELQKVAKE